MKLISKAFYPTDEAALLTLNGQYFEVMRGWLDHHRDYSNNETKFDGLKFFQNKLSEQNSQLKKLQCLVKYLYICNQNKLPNEISCLQIKNDLQNIYITTQKYFRAMKNGFEI